MVFLSDTTARRISRMTQQQSHHRRHGYTPRPCSLTLVAPTLRVRRISKKFFNLNMFWSGTLYRRINRWDRSWTLHTNPIYVDDLDSCNNNLTSSISTDSGCALDFDDLINGKVVGK